MSTTRTAPRSISATIAKLKNSGFPRPAQPVPAACAAFPFNGPTLIRLTPSVQSASWPILEGPGMRTSVDDPKMMHAKRFEELKATGALPTPTGVGLEILRLARDDQVSAADID